MAKGAWAWLQLAGGTVRRIGDNGAQLDEPEEHTDPTEAVAGACDGAAARVYVASGGTRGTGGECKCGFYADGAALRGDLHVPAGTRRSGEYHSGVISSQCRI